MNFKPGDIFILKGETKKKSFVTQPLILLNKKHKFSSFGSWRCFIFNFGIVYFEIDEIQKYYKLLEKAKL